jgi:hypothetical protein
MPPHEVQQMNCGLYRKTLRMLIPRGANCKHLKVFL